ncbi:unnamed protein product [Prunus armeniaca]|uniref:Uncharacterized protein n=1 Tax=Prunus armeniaca TaxID=36596 RepID=A0A6J5X421_PRUAR|nr:hypothetical protein GBA52_012107 [Prunus armeniaca]CAB4305698.1 unnamed protein product [Prunus armeniaca]
MLDASLDGADLNRFAPSKEIKYDKFGHHAGGVLLRTCIGSLIVLEFLQTLLVMAFGWLFVDGYSEMIVRDLSEELKVMKLVF